MKFVSWIGIALIACAPGAQAAAPPAPAVAPVGQPVIQAGDIDRFWVAYDAVRSQTDRQAKLAQFQHLYLDPATPGLRALMAARGYTPDQYIDAIENWPKFWASIRPLTGRAREAAAPLAKDLATFRAIYPDIKPASITYAIGVLRTGGTTQGNMVLIGAEIALADETVDVSELPERMRTRLGTFFATRPFTNNGQNNIHEYVHTQQEESGESLAARVVYEGVAEFVAEQVTGHRPPLQLYVYGPAHRDAVRDQFRADMAKTDWNDWLYNNDHNIFGVPDMGYFVGYEIARNFYERAPDKRAAIRTMIQLHYGDDEAVRAYIAQSGYLTDDHVPAAK
ncbi:hypothetical protein AEAC466_05230 [Asticcacaulis sp. AC466]|uniref:hypothetical protein n=1 Tax=Asticcacaulis sp. AC466 TaxID=1282362 RepID=UPI0003C3B945|nr:hypothetical protein [Asticcacaulis sp. AC466]ESQ85114.1 hypothetical protein AEAC466_05230 [Asticcacaulis sp. AC466]